jgi:PGDYG protein
MRDKDQQLLEEAYQRILIEQITDEWFQQGAFEAYKKPAKEPYEVATQDGTLQSLEGSQPYKAGYYIMTGPTGEKYSMPPEEFKKLKQDNGDGTASPKKIIKLAKLADSDGKVMTPRGVELEYKSGEDYIVKHGPGDYGVVKKDIFPMTYAF